MERDCESELSKLNIEQNACIYHFGASVIHGQRSNILRLLITGSWDFVTTAFVMPWIIILFIYPCVFEVAVDVYFFIRNVFDKNHKKR